MLPPNPYHFKHPGVGDVMRTINAGKRFNTAGPNKTDKHYQIPPLDRWDLDEILDLIDNERYFILHAPRQTGKTTCLMALMHHLNAEGQYVCVYANIEVAQPSRENYDDGDRIIANTIADSIALYLKDDRPFKALRTLETGTRTQQLLRFWTQHSSKPTVLLLDEVDALVGDSLISLLRQIRAGYN